jgi:hypothetical protein
MQQPLKLSDDELDAVLAAARPLPVQSRDEFLQAVADALANEREIGPGAVFRICRETQKRYFDPPICERGTLHGGKYDG